MNEKLDLIIDMVVCHDIVNNKINDEELMKLLEYVVNEVESQNKLKVSDKDKLETVMYASEHDKAIGLKDQYYEDLKKALTRLQRMENNIKYAKANFVNNLADAELIDFIENGDSK